MRRVVTLTTSRIVLTLATPLAPSIKGFDELPQPTTVVATDGTPLGVISGGGELEPIALRSLPDHVRHAALAAEDQNFYRHGGIDPEAIARAIVHNVRGKHEGASTITQQLAKINYVGSRHTLFRKFREALYALKLEQKYSKDELLERYLNQAYFGDGAYGIGAAARKTFGLDAAHLTPAQAALITGRIRGPVSRDPRKHPQLATARRNVVLKNMREHGWLTKEEYTDALATPLVVAPFAPTASVSRAPAFVEFVRREANRLDALGGSPTSRSHRVATGGLIIQTTLDFKAYDGAVAAVREHLGRPGDPTTAVVSVVPGDGAIKSLFGGLAPDRRFDPASRGRRQAGSAFKPFVYLAALRAKVDPRSVFDGTSPRTLTYKGSSYVVNNFEGQSTDSITIDDALVHSVNTVFAQLVLQPGVGPASVAQAATDAGIAADHLSRDRDRPSIALGGLNGGVSPLEMASAYATFAAKGIYAEPYAILRVRDRHGHDLYLHHLNAHRAVDQQLAGVLNAALVRVVQQGTGAAAQVPGWTVGGKTGTTQRFGDAWFVGITPPLATAVWVGHPEGIVPMTNVHGREVSGGSFPAMIFSDAMRSALQSVSPRPLFTASADGLGLTMVGTTSTSATTDTSTTTTAVTPDTPPPALPPTTDAESPTTRRPTTTTATTKPPPASTSSTGKK